MKANVKDEIIPIRCSFQVVLRYWRKNSPWKVLQDWQGGHSALLISQGSCLFSQFLSISI